MGLNSGDGNIKRYAFILTIYLYYLVYQTWSCTLVQVSVVQSSENTPPASVSSPPPPPPHTHTHTHTHFMLAGKRAGGERKIIMYGTGFPLALENLENYKKKFHAWKNHGI